MFMYPSHKRSTTETESLALRGPIVATLVMLVAVMACTATPAFAFRGHIFGHAFAGQGAGRGQLSSPASVTVNDVTGNVYVADEGNHRVEIFSAVGAYRGQFDASGTSEFEGKIEKGTSPPTGAFVDPRAVTVDNYCYVHKLAEPKCRQEDPSAGDVYVGDQVSDGNNVQFVIDKFTAEGGYLGQITGTPEVPLFRALLGLTADGNGGLWIGESAVNAPPNHEGITHFTDANTNEFAGFVEPGIDEASTGLTQGLALDEDGNFYPHLFFEKSGSVGKFLPSGKPVTEHFGGEASEGVGAWGVATEFATNNVYVNSGAVVSRLTSTGGLVERFGLGLLTEGTGIGVDSATGQVYIADAATGVVNEFPLEPPSEPRIENESVSEVTAESATLDGEINPRGAATTYRFEYGICSTLSSCGSNPYEASVPVSGGFVGSDFEIHTLDSVHLQGLRAHSTYHFRIVATNSHSPREGTLGTEKMFVTEALGGTSTLPDGRTWELVSPPDKRGALIKPIGEVGVAQAAADGSAITYLTNAPTEANPQGYSREVQVLSAHGSNGWASKDIALPDEGATGYGLEGDEYRFFSSDLSSAIVQPVGAFNPSLSDAASEQTPFLRSLLPNGPALAPCTSDCYRPLVAACPGLGEECASAVESTANTPPGTNFGEDSRCPPFSVCGPYFLGATEDDRHVIFEAKTPLVEGEKETDGLYEWSSETDRISLVSVLPNGEPAGSSASPNLGTQDGSTRGAISDDGSRVTWSEFNGEGHLFLRDVALERTIQLDAVQGGSGTGGGRPIFQFATSNGAKVLFTDESRLTSDSGATQNNPDLYECDISELAGELKCELKDLTPAVNGGPVDVLNLIAGSSSNASTVYFAANGAFPGTGASQGDCDDHNGSPSARCNLYVSREGQVTLVAVLSGADLQDWGSSNIELSDLTTRVSQSGDWLAFMSQQELTGYDNRDAQDGLRDEEVFLYHATAGLGEKALVCASCNPTGARPVGVEYLKLESGEGGIVGGDRVWPVSQQIAANVPGWTPFAGAGREARYQSRYLSDSGRLFFNSSDDLVPEDTNGTEDVYEYEPPGTGTCATSNVTFSEASGGCVGLISSGTSPDESAFLDASESGGDVFFLTTSRLVGADFDNSRDVYDAHECTTASPCAPEPAAERPSCTNAEACRAAPTPQPAIFGSPASSTFTGIGDVTPSAPEAVKSKALTASQKLAATLRACHKKPKRKRATCERQARRTYSRAHKGGK